MIERRHHAVRVEREIIRLELIAREQIELLLPERKLFGVEHEPHPLTAGGLRRVVEREGHGGSRFFWTRALPSRNTRGIAALYRCARQASGPDGCGTLEWRHSQGAVMSTRIGSVPHRCSLLLAMM